MVVAIMQVLTFQNLQMARLETRMLLRLFWTLIVTFALIASQQIAAWNFTW